MAGGSEKAEGWNWARLGQMGTVNVSSRGDVRPLGRTVPTLREVGTVGAKRVAEKAAPAPTPYGDSMTAASGVIDRNVKLSSRYKYTLSASWWS